MCGILGILNIENKAPIDRSLLESMSSLLFLDTGVIRRHLRPGLGMVNRAFQLWVIYNFLVWREGVAR
jgi:hypothetical protein